jgi:hypothetical protein
LVKGIDRTDLRSKTHPAVGAFILVNLNIDPPGNLLVPPEILDPPQRTIREAPLTTNASVITDPHRKTSFPTIGFLRTDL